ncbi:MAG: ATPase, partial [Bacteroidales bacterium]|nr:ATPase [Bacteroidales bacterium]
LIPIEVKSGNNAHLRSLHRFMDKAPHDIAVRFWAEPFSVDSVTTPSGKSFRLFNLPYYYAGSLETLLRG